jgi:FkbM family methyltransferase
MRLHDSGWFDDELEQLLGEDPVAAHERESTSLDRTAAPYDGRLVLFGAGRLGRKVLAALQGTGLQVVGFADNNSSLWGTRIDGVRVLQPGEAAGCYGRSAAFLVCIFAAEAVGRMQNRIEELRALGCETAVSFVPAMWKRPEILLPHWAVDLPTRILLHANEIRQCARLFSDERSMQEFLAQVKWRLFGDFSVLPAAESGLQYFADDLFCPIDDEVFVDCGAFDGDTLKAFLRQSQGKFRRAICFEPDQSNFEKLKHYANSLPEAIRDRIDVWPFAVGAVDRVARFAAAGDTSSRVGTGASEVTCVSLDCSLKESTPTFLKFDIEGAEPDALFGAKRTISSASPVLAVCLYHAPDHLWRLPLLIDQISPGYGHFLRPYKEVWELVGYAVPENRKPKDGRHEFVAVTESLIGTQLRGI